MAITSFTRNDAVASLLRDAGHELSGPRRYSDSEHYAFRSNGITWHLHLFESEIRLFEDCYVWCGDDFGQPDLVLNYSDPEIVKKIADCVGSVA